MKQRETPNIGKIWEDTALIPPHIQFSDIEGEKKHYNDGDVIIYEDEAPAKSMYLVLSGKVNVYKSYGKPQESLLATLSPGALFGEMSLFLSEPRTATSTANGSVTVIEITRLDMHRLMTNDPDFAYSIVVALCTRLRNTLRLLNID